MSRYVIEGKDRGTRLFHHSLQELENNGLPSHLLLGEDDQVDESQSLQIHELD